MPRSAGIRRRRRNQETLRSSPAWVDAQAGCRELRFWVGHLFNPRRWPVSAEIPKISSLAFVKIRGLDQRRLRNLAWKPGGWKPDAKGTSALHCTFIFTQFTFAALGRKSRPSHWQ